MNLPPLKILRNVSPEMLLRSQNALRLLHQSIENDPLSCSVEEILDDIYEGVSFLWTWGTGLCLTTIVEHSKFKVLYLTNVIGEGYIQNIAEIDHDIESHAKAMGAKFIIGDVPRLGLVKVYERRGGKAFHRVLREVK